MKETLITVKAAITAGLTALAAFLGWKGILLLAWVGVMALDYLSGTLAACREGKWSSAVARQGLWHKGGMILTAPIEVTEDTLRVNFASSALGGMKIWLFNEAGEALEGYESYVLFGDTVDLPVEFERNLGALKGQRVRLRIALQDTHLYSFTI